MKSQLSKLTSLLAVTVILTVLSYQPSASAGICESFLRGVFNSPSKEEKRPVKFGVPLSAEPLFSLPTPLILIGETHPQKEAKAWLINNMAVLKAAGVTHLALEMFNFNVQESLLDAFYKHEATKEDLIAYLKKEWIHIPTYYADLVEAARDHGIAAVAIDRRHLERNDGIFSTNGARDLHMAKTLAQLVRQNPQNKIVALIGGNHAQIVPNRTAGVLTQMRIPMMSFKIDYDFLDLKSNIRLTIEKAGIEPKNLFIPQTSAGKTYNGYIFLSGQEK